MIPTQPLNIMIHMLILFTFLALFFFLNISKVEEDTFKHEITLLVDKHLIESVDKSTLKSLVENNRNIFVQLSSLYKQPDESTRERNQGLKLIAMFITLIMLSALVSIILTLKFSCHEKIKSVWSVVIENVITFSIVGLFEYLFFINIAVRYVPTKPSFLVKSLIDALKKD